MTDIVKETAEEAKEYIVARLKVPVFFYYLLALAIWNWDIIIMILKSKLDVEVIIINIKKDYSEFSRVLLPLLIAVFSSILFPALMVLLDWTLSKVNLERIKSAKKVAEAEAEAQYDIQVKRNKTDKLKDLNEKISLQESELNSVRATNSEFEEKIVKLNDDLSKGQSDLSILRKDNYKLKTRVKQLEDENHLFDDNNIAQLRQEFSDLTKRFAPANILKTIDEILVEDYVAKIGDSGELYKILTMERFVEDYEDEIDLPFFSGKRLTKKGFALQFFILGKISNERK